MRFKTRHCDVHKSTPHSSFLARLASGAFYKPFRVTLMTYYEFVIHGGRKSLLWTAMVK